MSHRGDSEHINTMIKSVIAGINPEAVCQRQECRRMMFAAFPRKIPNAVNVCHDTNSLPRILAGAISLSNIGTTLAFAPMPSESLEFSLNCLKKVLEQEEKSQRVL